MALAIAYYIRPQQTMKKIISQNEEINAFIDKEFGADEDNIQSDYGSEIEVF